MAERWSNPGLDYVEDKRADAFLDELEELCKKHDITISHEDGHGAFILENYDYTLQGWIRAAHLGESFEHHPDA